MEVLIKLFREKLMAKSRHTHLWDFKEREYRGLQVAWHKNRDEIGACAKFGGNFELKFCACADFVAIFVPSNLQSSVLHLPTLDRLTSP